MQRCHQTLPVYLACTILAVPWACTTSQPLLARKAITALDLVRGHCRLEVNILYHNLDHELFSHSKLSRPSLTTFLSKWEITSFCLCLLLDPSAISY